MECCNCAVLLGYICAECGEEFCGDCVSHCEGCEEPFCDDCLDPSKDRCTLCQEAEDEEEE